MMVRRRVAELCSGHCVWFYRAVVPKRICFVLLSCVTMPEGHASSGQSIATSYQILSMAFQRKVALSPFSQQGFCQWWHNGFKQWEPVYISTLTVPLPQLDFLDEYIHFVSESKTFFFVSFNLGNCSNMMVKSSVFSPKNTFLDSEFSFFIKLFFCRDSLCVRCSDATVDVPLIICQEFASEKKRRLLWILGRKN